MTGAGRLIARIEANLKHRRTMRMRWCARRRSRSCCTRRSRRRPALRERPRAAGVRGSAGRPAQRLGGGSGARYGSRRRERSHPRADVAARRDRARHEAAGHSGRQSVLGRHAARIRSTTSTCRSIVPGVVPPPPPRRRRRRRPRTRAVLRQRAADPRHRPSGYQSYFLPRGFIFADANSLGTGHSTGCPTIGGARRTWR